jgi:hypothetical protein
MATSMRRESSAKSKTADPTIGEEEWSGSKLTVIGVLTLALAFTILYLLSPNGNPV